MTPTHHMMLHIPSTLVIVCDNLLAKFGTSCDNNAKTVKTYTPYMFLNASEANQPLWQI